MADKKNTGLFYAGSTNSSIKTFPKEYRSGLFRQWDTRFTLIFFSCLVSIGTIVFLLSRREPPDEATEKEISRIQERYAKLVLEKPIPKEPEKKPLVEPLEEQQREEMKEDKPDVDRTKESLEQQRQRKKETRESRREKREAVQKEIASRGIFAAITAAGNGTPGASSVASDLLGSIDDGPSLEGIDISGGEFVSRNTDVEKLKSRKEKKVSGVDIEKAAVEKVQEKRVASAGKVSVRAREPEIAAESGSAVTTSRSCIQKVVQRESRRLKRVYEMWLKRDPELGGQIKIKFTILPGGTVTNSSIAQSSTGNNNFDQALLRYVNRWDFSSCTIAEPYEIIYPFAFSGTR